MTTERWFKNRLDSFKEDFEFRFETLILNITEKISKRMKEKNISRKKLSQLLRISPPAVTKILNGNANFTLKTLLSVADALELDLNIEFREKVFVTTTATSGISVGTFATSGESFSTLISGSTTITSIPFPESEEISLAQVA